jgi:predicted nucleic acid-binding protein
VARRIFILDSDPTGLACHEPGNLEAVKFRAWMYGQRYAKVEAEIVIPAIIDYEIRRELVLNELGDAVKRLDALYTANRVRPLSISDAAMRTAARLWADVRRRGMPTAHDHALDADVILSAQAMEFCSDADDWQIITENVDHIARYVGDRARSRKVVVSDFMSSAKSIAP